METRVCVQGRWRQQSGSNGGKRLEKIRSFKVLIFQRVWGILGWDKRKNLEFFGVSLFGGELDRSISLGLVCLVSVKGLSGQEFRR